MFSPGQELYSTNTRIDLAKSLFLNQEEKTMIHIENIHIHVNPHQQHNSIAEAMLKAVFTASESEPEGEEIVATTPPRIGEYWRGQGGIYAGLVRGENGQPDYHLILDDGESQQEFTWEAAKACAQRVIADGHQDFTLPNRTESALLYTNLRDKFNPNYWYWTGTKHSAIRAFSQSFYSGAQNDYNDTTEAPARFVRRVAIHPQVTESDV